MKKYISSLFIILQAGSVIADTQSYAGNPNRVFAKNMIKALKNQQEVFKFQDEHPEIIYLIFWSHQARVNLYCTIIKKYTDQFVNIDELVDVYTLFNKKLHFKNEEGIAFQLPSDQYQTALMHFFDDYAIFEALLICGANPFIDNSYGISLLQMMRIQKMSEQLSPQEIEKRIKLMFDLYCKHVLEQINNMRPIQAH